MAKKIEVITATNAQTLKVQLQEMVNDGWEIKGVIGYNPHNDNSDPFVILERTIVAEPIEEETYSQNEDPFPEMVYTRPEPLHQEICISMG